MLKYWALLRISFRGLINNFGAGGGGKSKKRAASGTGIMVLMGLLSLYISGVYSFAFGSMLKQTDMLGIMPVMMAIVAVLMSLMFTALAASGIVFGSKDMDLMLSLPLSAFSIMLSKTMALYLENLVFSVFMMLPAGGAYLYFGGAGGVWFILRLIVAVLFLPIIPTAFALVIGFALAWVTSHLRRKALLANIAYFGFFILVMAFAFKMNTMMSSLMLQGESINKAFSTWLYPFGLFRDAIYGNIFALLLFILITAVPFFIIVYLFSTRYKKIITVLSSHTTRSDYKMQSLKATGQFAALFKKEYTRFFSTPIYLFNAGFGVLMAVGASVFAIIKKSDISAVLLQIGADAPVLPLLVLAMSFIYITTYPCCVSISLEGKTLWVLKEAPIAPKTLFMAKALLNILMIWATGLVCVPMLWYAFDLAVADAIALLVLTAASGIYVAFSCLIINLFFPKMDATNDSLVVKQSTSAVLGMFINLLVPAIGCGAYYLLNGIIGFIPFLFATSVVLFGIDYLLWAFLKSKGSKMLLAL
ncbi:MAG: hypothetical protein RR814_06455 [Oscillospiraceae bacterium]